MRACERACVHAYVAECMRAFIHACVHTWLRACARACVHAYVDQCVQACVHACVRTWLRACVRACMQTQAGTHKRSMQKMSASREGYRLPRGQWPARGGAAGAAGACMQPPEQNPHTTDHDFALVTQVALVRVSVCARLRGASRGASAHVRLGRGKPLVEVHPARSATACPVAAYHCQPWQQGTGCVTFKTNGLEMTVSGISA